MNDQQQKREFIKITSLPTSEKIENSDGNKVFVFNLLVIPLSDFHDFLDKNHDTIFEQRIPPILVGIFDPDKMWGEELFQDYADLFHKAVLLVAVESGSKNFEITCDLIRQDGNDIEANFSRIWFVYCQEN